MRNHPVHWRDGLFLVPQHFQAAERHWQELLRESERYDHEYNYGLRSLDFSHQAIKDLQFQLDACYGRTKDGTLIALEEGEAPERISLRERAKESPAESSVLSASLEESLDRWGEVTVYLGLPKFRWGATNVGNPEDTGLHRYREQAITRQDESFGGNDQELLVKQLCPRLVLSTEELGNFELLPLARIRRAGDGGPELDAQFIPPLLAIDAWPPLAHGVIRDLYDQLGSRIDEYGAYIDTVDTVIWPSPDPADGQWLMMLAHLGEAYATLHGLVNARGVHPFVAYLELCRIVGRLSYFEPGHRPAADLPKYDHEALGPIFFWFRDTIRRLLEAPRPRYSRTYFEGGKDGLQVSIDSDWLEPAWEWYVGVYHPDLTSSQCIELFQPDRFFWKLGDIELLETLFSSRYPGLHFHADPKPHPVLPRLNTWTYFKVTREPETMWKRVCAGRTLGIRMQPEMIENRDQLEGQRSLRVQARGFGLIRLEFALFAIPPNR